MDTPLVTVVIPVYNAEKYIYETLNSVYRQTYKNYEVIIIDDGSTDDSLKIIKEVVNRDVRFNYLSIPNSGRPSVPRNLGIKKSRGKFIAFLDSDDIWFKKKLSIQVKYMLKNNSYITHMYYRRFTEKNQNIDVYPQDPDNFQGNIVSQLLLRSEICTSSTMLRKEVFEQVGFFREEINLKAVEDFDLWIRVAKKFKIDFVDSSVQVLYRVNPHSLSSNNIEQTKKRIRVIHIHKNKVSFIVYIKSIIRTLVFSFKKVFKRK